MMNTIQYFDDAMNKASVEAEEKALIGDTKENRFLAFQKIGWFDDMNDSITSPDFRVCILGTQTVVSREITGITGKAGAGKSTFLAIIIAILLGRKEFAGIRCVTPCSKVLWIDTEKGQYSCKQKMKVFRSIANIPESVKLTEAGVYFRTMRGIPADDMRFFIEKLTEGQQYDAIVVDGIFDLTEDPQKDYSPVIKLLQRLADNGATVFAMLHTNKNDDNMRYALGTEMQRLITSRFDVSYDEKTGDHIIKHTKSNDTAYAPEVRFRYDAYGNIVPVTGRIDVKKIIGYVFTDGKSRDWKKLRSDFAAKAGVSMNEAFYYCQMAQKDNLLITELDGSMNLNKEHFRG